MKWLMKNLMALLLIVVLMGVIGYLQHAFGTADVKTAMRLVEEVNVNGKPLGWTIDKFLPKDQRNCEVSVLKSFYGHMQVVCRHKSDIQKNLAWQVSLADGMVKPSNQPAINLGKGELPW